MWNPSIGRYALCLLAWTLLAATSHADDKQPETKEEKATRALERQISVDFTETPFADVMSFVRDYAGIDLTIDEVALRDAGLSLDLPITLNKKEETIGAVLAQLLAPHGLKAAVKEDGLHITSSERELEVALQQPISMGFTEEPLSRVLDFVEGQTKVNIYLDLVRLHEVGVDLDLPITLKLDNVTVERALQLLLEPLELHAVAVDDVLKVTSKSYDNIRVKVYPVHDLVLLGNASEHLTVSGDSLVDTIETVIEPCSWEEEGGQGTIRFEPLTLSLVIRQTIPIHRQVDTLLKDLRTSKSQLTRKAGKDGLPELTLIEQAQVEAIRSQGSGPYGGGGFGGGAGYQSSSKKSP